MKRNRRYVIPHAWRVLRRLGVRSITIRNTGRPTVTIDPKASTEVLRVEDAGRLIGMSTAAVYDAAQVGLLPTFTPKDWRFRRVTRQALREFVLRQMGS